MPKFSDDTLLQRALEPAINDRLTFVDAYSGEGQWAEEARGLIVRFKALQGKKFAGMAPDELEAARLAFIYAEQWKSSLADALKTSSKKEMDEALRAARLFREVRLRRWGLTALEQTIAASTLVLVPGSCGVPR